MEDVNLNLIDRIKNMCTASDLASVLELIEQKEFESISFVKYL